MNFEEYLGEVIIGKGITAFVDNGKNPHQHKVGTEVHSYHKGAKMKGTVVAHVKRANGSPAVEVKTEDGKTHISGLVEKA